MRDRKTVRLSPYNRNNPLQQRRSRRSHDEEAKKAAAAAAAAHLTLLLLLRCPTSHLVHTGHQLYLDFPTVTQFLLFLDLTTDGAAQERLSGWESGCVQNAVAAIAVSTGTFWNCVNCGCTFNSEPRPYTMSEQGGPDEL